MEIGTSAVFVRATSGPLGTSIQVDINPEADPGAVVRAAHCEVDRLIEEGLWGETLLVRIEPDGELAALVAVAIAPKFGEFANKVATCMKRVAVFDEMQDAYVICISDEHRELGTVIRTAE